MNRPATPPRGTGPPPQVADHLVLRRIGRGSYGEVWLARNVLGYYRAVKVVWRRDFRSDAPFEREFAGILKYEPVSRAHSGHVDILQIGRNAADGCFYYVMELADDATDSRPGPAAPAPAPDAPAPDWLAAYVPKTLQTEQHRQGRLPASQCVALGIVLADALDHLHRHGLVHRDIKPANIIFIAGQPELADIGLVTDSEAGSAALGTDGFIAPEGAGTPPGDLYALGKVLYELATGLDRKQYPELPAALGEWTDRVEFLALNTVLARACAARMRDRYGSAAELLADLRALRDGPGLVSKRPGGAARGGRRAARATLVALALLGCGAALWPLLRPRPAAPSLSRSAALLTAAEEAAGFHPLFDGATLDSWRYEAVGTNVGPAHWLVDQGLLRRTPTEDPRWSRLVYEGPPLPRDFELRFEWRLSPGSQGGVFYLPGLFKYQLIDGALPVAQKESLRPGALFAVTGPTNDLARPTGQWNEGWIVRRGWRLEHWLNGQLAVRLDLRQPEFRDRFLEAEARIYGRQTLAPALTRKPQLRLLECGKPIDFRRIRIRSLPAQDPRNDDQF